VARPFRNLAWLADFICFRLKLLRSASWCEWIFEVPGGSRRYKIARNNLSRAMVNRTALLVRPPEFEAEPEVWLRVSAVQAFDSRKPQ